MINLIAVQAANAKAFIFDLDGVLLKSTECHRLAFQEIFEPLGIHDFDYSPYAGWRTAEVVEDVLRNRGFSTTVESISALAREKSRRARLKLDETQPIDPFCGPVLAVLGASYPLALASSGSRESVDAFLKLSGARSFFRSILSGDDVSSAKPDPEIYLRSARQLGIDPADCVVVEDAVAGVRAGRSANAAVIGIEGTTSRKALEAAGADAVLPDLSALVAQFRRAQVDPSQWTAIIPAAGRGSRLGFHRPKILYPVGGRLILDWLLDFLEPNCSALVFVLSPDGASEVVAELEQRIPGRFESVIQEVPTGMGDAVGLGLKAVRTPHAAVVWGDQVALRRESVEICLALHAGPLAPDITCPTVIRPKPYIHFERDARGRLLRVLQAREGDAMPEIGESDTGFFCFRTARLRELLEQAQSHNLSMGSRTAEFNLLPVIPWAAQCEEGRRVLTPRHMSVQETVGINSASDAAAVERFMAEVPFSASRSEVQWR